MTLRRMFAASLFAVTLATGTSSAGWDNVFQVTCNDCKKPRTSYYAAPPCDPCPQPERRVEYIQRTYYQPVTEYKQESYYEPVERQVKSYYWEPVTSYRYTTYYDPCTGCPQEMACPVTSYKLRSKCNTVTEYLKKCRTVPVTSYREVTTQQPVVTYYYPPRVSSSNYLPALPPGAAAPPTVEPLRSNPPTVLPERGVETGPLIPKTDLPTEQRSFPRSMPRSSTSGKVNTASFSKSATLRGEVVENDRQTPRANAKLILVNPANTEDRIPVRTNAFGEFDSQVPTGEWYVYLSTGDGKAVYHKKIRVTEFDNPTYRVVSR